MHISYGIIIFINLNVQQHNVGRWVGLSITYSQDKFNWLIICEITWVRTRALFGRYFRLVSPYALFGTFVTLIGHARTKGSRPDTPKQQRGTSKISKNRKSVWKYQKLRCLSTSLGGTRPKNMIEWLCKNAVQGDWALSLGYYDISKGCFPFLRYSKKGAFSSRTKLRLFLVLGFPCKSICPQTTDSSPITEQTNLLHFSMFSK